MKSIRVTFSSMIVFISFLMSATYCNAQTQPDIEKLDDAVVLVLIYDFEGNCVGHGSGFLIDSIGTVVTNYHVVKEAYSIKIRTNINNRKEDFQMDKILSGSSSKDLAKISIKNPYSRVFPYLTLSQSYPVKGEDCWAIGTPANPEYMNTVSKGLVSNLMLQETPKIIQTNAEITHGSSGGALINSKGEVIGVTSAGDQTDDGSRASINFAIWIGELSTLTPINKESLVDPETVPGQLCFYTDSPFSGSVYLYIDGIYIGSFSKYFQEGYTPSCGDDGTITRYLYSGDHTYSVYYYYYGTIYHYNATVSSGKCKKIKIQGPKANNNVSNTTPKKKVVDDGSITEKYKFMISSGLSVAAYAGEDFKAGVPFTLFAEKYFADGKYSLRPNLQFRKTLFDLTYYSVGMDYKRFFGDLPIYAAGSANFRLTRDMQTDHINNSYVHYWENKFHFVPVLRLGGELFRDSYRIEYSHYNDGTTRKVTNLSEARIVPTLDFGVCYNTALKKVVFEVNLLLGFKFVKYQLR